MTATVLWELPVASTALLEAGVVFEVRRGREIALTFTHETDDGTRDVALAFEGVEAFKSTYYYARDTFMHQAYDRLVDCGETPWLDQVRNNLSSSGADVDGLEQLMINFDDGPSYEVICRAFRVEASDSV